MVTVQELLLRPPLETLTNFPVGAGALLTSVRGNISDSEGRALLAGSDGTEGQGRSHSWLENSKGRWGWTSEEKFHLKMGGNKDAVERVLDLGSKDLVCNSHSASNWLCAFWQTSSAF